MGAHVSDVLKLTTLAAGDTAALVVHARRRAHGTEDFRLESKRSVETSVMKPLPHRGGLPLIL